MNDSEPKLGNINLEDKPIGTPYMVEVDGKPAVHCRVLIDAPMEIGTPITLPDTKESIGKVIAVSNPDEHTGMFTILIEFDMPLTKFVEVHQAYTKPEMEDSNVIDT